MKKKLLILILLATSILYAQLTLQGTVIDEFNNPMPFVSVYLKNTVQGTTTNNKGEFYLKTKKKKGVLEISFVGFQTQTLPVNQQTKNLKIIIKEDANELDEVIIVTKPKKTLKEKRKSCI